MAKLTHSYLHKVAFEIFKAVGTPESECTIIANHLIAANLAGHDSHGVIQIATYVDRIKNGDIVPGAPFEILNETESTLSIDGNWGFGFVVTEKSMELLIKKAKNNHVASATIAHQSHVGRLTDYGLMASSQDLIAIVMADSGRTTKHVAPFGGREPRIGTNPICMSLPSNLEGPVYFDFATSAVAGNKLVVAAARNEQVQENLIIDAEGNMTADPQGYMDGGAILPVGGPQGHKGYGLGFMVEVMTSLLTGLGFGHYPPGKHNDGVFIALFNPSAFQPIDKFKEEVAGIAQYMKTSKPAKGFKEVFYPGELEWRTSNLKRKQGIEIEDSTWNNIWTLVKELKLTDVLKQ